MSEKPETIYMPEPRFVFWQTGKDQWRIAVDHVEFVVGFGEPIERVWARSIVGDVHGDRASVRKAINLEARRRGYTK